MNTNKKAFGLLGETLTGVGQIFLQQSHKAGTLSVLAMTITHWALGLFCFLGSLIGCLTAYALRFPKNQIEQGLYGFNGSLAMMCVLVTFGYGSLGNPMLWCVAIFTAVLATLIMRVFLYYQKMALTFPFVLSCWLVLGFVGHYQLFGLTRAVFALSAMSDWQKWAMPFYAWGEVNFSDNLITGILLFVAVAIGEFGVAIWGLIFAVLASVFAYGVFDIPQIELFAGLYGYSAVLVACVFAGRGRSSLYYGLGAMLLSVPIQYFTKQIGLPTYTFGFIGAVWIMTFIKNKLSKAV